jgi:hypothetical protein
MKATSFLVNLSYIFGYVEFLILMPTTINPVGFKILFKGNAFVYELLF